MLPNNTKSGPKHFCCTSGHVMLLSGEYLSDAVGCEEKHLACKNTPLTTPQINGGNDH